MAVGTSVADDTESNFSDSSTISSFDRKRPSKKVLPTLDEVEERPPKYPNPKQQQKHANQLPPLDEVEERPLKYQNPKQQNKYANQLPPLDEVEENPPKYPNPKQQWIHANQLPPLNKVEEKPHKYQNPKQQKTYANQLPQLDEVEEKPPKYPNPKQQLKHANQLPPLNKVDVKPPKYPNAKSDPESASTHERPYVYKILKVIFDDSSAHKIRTIRILAVMLVITFVRFIAGAVKLSSRCSMEYDVAVYLFVKSWVGFIFWIPLLVIVIKQKMALALENLHYAIVLVVTMSFAFIWLIIGSVWVFAKHQDMRKDCPTETKDWDAHFINFAIVLTVADWLLATVFTFLFSGCLLQHIPNKISVDKTDIRSS